MKKIVLLLTLILSSASYAANLNWYDIEIWNRYVLKQDIVFDNGISFKAGSSFDVLDFYAGGIPPIAYFDMHYNECKNPDQTADMILVNVKQETGPDVVVGAQLYEGCNIGFFIEVKEIFTPSLFDLD